SCLLPVGLRRQPRQDTDADTAQTVRSLRSFATCPVARTLYCATSIFPSGSITNVERITPVTVLPYICFSPYAPQVVSTSLSASESNGKVRPSLSRNLASFAGLSGEMPSTSRPAPFNSARLSRKSQASLVQPGVPAAG